MIWRNLLCFVGLAFVGWLADSGMTCPSSFAQAPPRSVVDYYLALPDKYAGEIDRAEREELISDDRARVIAKDIPNGYLAVSGDASSPGLTVALFKKADGSYLVGVTAYDETSEDFYCLSYHDGNWQDVTAVTIPEYSKRLRYELPRYGTSIKVKSQAGKVLYELTWHRGKFTKKVL